MVPGQTKTEKAETGRSAMALTTNAVGSYPKPDYLAQARTQFSQGKIERAELDKLERQATEYWIRSQERIGLDVLVHGEMERGDMVAYFAGEPGGNPIGGMKLGAGIVNGRNTRIESLEQIEESIRRLSEVVPPDKIYVNPSCGLEYLPREVAFEKLKIMVQGARLAEGVLA